MSAKAVWTPLRDSWTTLTCPRRCGAWCSKAAPVWSAHCGPARSTSADAPNYGERSRLYADTPCLAYISRTLVTHTLYQWQSVAVVGPGLRASGSVGSAPSSTISLLTSGQQSRPPGTAAPTAG